MTQKPSVIIALMFLMIGMAVGLVIVNIPNVDVPSVDTTEEITLVTPPIETITPVPSTPVAPTPIESEKPEYIIQHINSDIIMLAQMAWGEARGCSDMEIAATMWCVLNRVDVWGRSIERVITAPNQFHGYSADNPVDAQLYDLAKDVLTRWQMERQGASFDEVGRVLPPEYLYFSGDGTHNYFRDSYENGNVWDWSYPNPYETEGN